MFSRIVHLKPRSLINQFYHIKLVKIKFNKRLENHTKVMWTASLECI